MSKSDWIATILPPAARRQLTQAAAVDPGSPFGESFTRERELHKTTLRVKLQYPEFFRTFKFHNHR